MSAQINQKVFFGIVLVLLSSSTDLGDANFVANSTNICLGAAASAEYTLNFPGAKSIACAAACSAAFIEKNNVIAANLTSCSALTAQVALAGNTVVGNCKNVAINACAITASYVNATQNDVNTLLLAACVAAELGTTGCNAQYSIAYIACNIAYTNYWIGCNIALQAYATLSLAVGAASNDCDLAFANVQASCNATAQTTHQACVNGAKTAQLSC